MILAALFPDAYRATFIGVPEEFGPMLAYAWVGGSIWGILFPVLVGTETIGRSQAIGNVVPWLHDEGTIAQIGSALLFFALAVVTARAARRRLA